MWIPKIASITLLLGLAPLAMAQTASPVPASAWDFNGAPSLPQSPAPIMASLGHLNLVSKVYSVADLVVPIDSNSTNGVCGGPAATAPDGNAAKADDLIKLITAMIKPASWNRNGGNARIDYFPIGMGLVVTQTPENQALVAELLSQLRRLQDLQVAIEIRVLRMPDDLLEKICADSPCRELFRTLRADDGGCERIGVDFLCDDCKTKTIFLNQEQTLAFCAAAEGDYRTSAMQAPKVTIFNGQEAVLQTGDTQYFMTDVKVVEHDGQKTFVPTNTQHFLGSRFAVKGVVAADHKSVAVRIKAQMSELDGPVPLFPITTMITPVLDGGAQGKPIPFTQFIQQPKFQKLVVEKTATIPDGATMVIPAGSLMSETRIEMGTPFLKDIPYLGRLFRNVAIGHESQSVVLLVTPRVIVNDEKPPANVGACPLVPFGCAGAACGQSVITTSGAQTCPSEKPECCAAKTKSASAPMNLADIVALASSGVCDDIVVNQIRTTGARFKLGTEDILFLKKNKVSDAVVMFMQNSSSRNDAAIVPATVPTPMPMMPPVHYYPAPVQGQFIPVPSPQVLPATCVPAYPAVQPPLGACPGTQCPAERIGRDMELCVDQSGVCRLVPAPVRVGNGAHSEIGETLIDAITGIVEVFAELMGIKAPDGQLPVPVAPTNGGMTLTTPRYLEHVPQYFPQEPDFPLTRELLIQEEAAGLLAPQNRPPEMPRAASPVLSTKTATAPLNVQPPESQKQKVALSIAEIIELGYMGADDKVIINQIRATGSTFELSNDDLRFLLQNGVSSAVIAEMQVSLKNSVDPNERMREILNESADLQKSK